MTRQLASGLLLCLLAACGKEEASPSEVRVVCEAGCLDGNLVSLGDVGVGARGVTTVLIANRGDVPVELKGATQAAKLAPFLAELACNPACPSETLAPGETFELGVGLRPEKLGAIDSRLDLGPIALDLQGNGTAPTVSCSPQQQNFGKVVVGTTERRTITCSNHGPHPTTIDIDRPTGSDAPAYFEVILEGNSDHTLTLEPEQEVSFYVTYLPTTDGPHIATMNIRAGAELVQKVRLEGTGIEGGLVLEPDPRGACHEMGYVAPGTSRELELELRNPGDHAVSVEGAVSTRSDFEVIEAPEVVAPGASAPLVVRYTAGGTGPVQTNVIVTTSAPGTQPSVCVGAVGGGPRLSCDKEALDFGPVQTNQSSELTFRCSNTGWDGQNLFVSDLAVPDGFVASVRGGVQSGGYAVGESFRVDVAFQPASAGDYSGELTIESNDSGAGQGEIAVTGIGLEAPPCVLRVPELLDFGNVSNRLLTLDVVLENQGEETCTLTDLEAFGTGFDAEPLARVDIPAGQILRVPVTFEPSAVSGQGILVFHGVFGPGETMKVVELWASDDVPHVVAKPVDFGTIATGCASTSRKVTLWPAAETAVGRVRALGPFSITSAPVEQADGQYELEVTYQPVMEGTDHGALVVETSEGDELVPMVGRANADAIGTERFGGQAIDFLYVADNSTTVMVEAVDYWGHFFTSTARTSGLDFQIGITTTGLTESSGCPGGVGGGEDGRLFPVIGTTPRIITPLLSAEEQDDDFLVNANVGICHGSELGLKAAFRALSPPVINHADDPRHPEANDGNLGFLRPDADLAVMVISDEEDQSPGLTGFYAAFLQSLKTEGQRVRFHSVVGDRDMGCANAQAGNRYIDVTDATGGRFVSMCANFDAMAELANDVFSPGSCLTLANVPVDPDAEGPATPAASIAIKRNGFNEAASHWTYEAATNRVCLKPSYLAEPGDRFEVTYRGASVCGAP